LSPVVIVEKGVHTAKSSGEQDGDTADPLAWTRADDGGEVEEHEHDPVDSEKNERV
jgi:hypothetical protein